MKRIVNSALVVLLCIVFITYSQINVYASVNDKKIALMGIVDTQDNADRTSWISTANMYLNGLNNANISSYTAFSPSTFLSVLQNNDMLLIHSHGDIYDILSIDGYGNRNWINNTDINALPANSLINLRIVFLGACNCGYNGTNSPNNFASRIYNKGAKCVIAYKGTVETSHNASMLRNFAICISNGDSVSTSLLTAKNAVYYEFGGYGNVDDYAVWGVDAIGMSNSSYYAIPTNGINYPSSLGMQVDMANSTIEEGSNIIFGDDGSRMILDTDGIACCYIYSGNSSEHYSLEEYISNCNTFFSNDAVNEVEANNGIIEKSSKRDYINGIPTNSYVLIEYKEGEVVAVHNTTSERKQEAIQGLSWINRDMVIRYITNEYDVSNDAIQQMALIIDNETEYIYTIVNSNNKENGEADGLKYYKFKVSELWR